MAKFPPDSSTKGKLFDLVQGGLGTSTLSRKIQEIKTDRWARTYGYSFLIADADSKDGSVQVPSVLEDDPGYADPAITPQNMVTLRLPPASLNITTQFASVVQATNNGVLEENSGVVFRVISIQGTTGIYPGRESKKDLRATKGSLTVENIFPAATLAIGAVSKAAKDVLFGRKIGTNLIDKDDPNGQSGYAHFWRLHNFIVRYAEEKKLRKNRSKRLLFLCPKDNIAYVVTPMSFELKKDANNPHQYKYSIVMKAWDIATNSYDTVKPEINKLENREGLIRGLLERIRRARRTVQLSSGVLHGIQSDIGDVLQLANQASLALKDVVGVGREILDFYPIFKSNIDLLIITNGQQWGSVLNHRANSSADFIDISKALNNGALTGPGTTSEPTPVSNQSSAFLMAGKVSANSLTSAPNGEDVDVQGTSSPQANQLLTKALDKKGLLEDVPLEELGTLPLGIQEAIDKEIEASTQITAGQVQKLANKMQEVSNNIAYNAGMMDPTYAALYGLPAPVSEGKTPTEEDILLAADIQDGQQALISALGLGDLFKQKPANPFLAANEVLEPEQQLPTPLSAFPVTVSQGSSIEDMARRYLGNPNRGKEIAILNGLRAPYIDEDGFSLPISLPSDRSFIVKDRSKLGIGQIVYISAPGAPSSRRTILGIDDLGGSAFRVAVDGLANLSIYQAPRSPTLHARLIGCVGSGDTILIPSEEQPEDDLISRPTSLSERLSYSERVFGIDMALSPTSDLLVSASGDVARSYGYDNAVQALRLIVETEKGELEQHLNYGLNVQVGQRITSDTIGDVRSRIRQAILSDRRFSDASVTTKLNGSALYIQIEAVGSAGTGLILVEFQVGL